MIKIDHRTRQVARISTVNVENDQKAVRLYFKCRNQVTDIVALSDCLLFFNYNNGGVNDRYAIDDLTIDGDYVTFSWLLGKNATAKQGETNFVLSAETIGEQGEILTAWHTKLSSFRVEKGLETDYAPTESQEDLFAQLVGMVNGKNPRLNAGQNITITDNQDGTQTISASGGGSSYTAGDGIVIDNDEISVDNDGTLKFTNGELGIDFATLSAQEMTSGKAVKSNDLEIIVSALNENIGNKQDALTVGQNININNGVISATDTTYSIDENSDPYLSIDDDKVSVILGEIIEGAQQLIATPGLANSALVADWIYWLETKTHNKLALKQDTLTAGTGISISNNVISATLGITIDVVQTLPQTGAEQTIYLVPKQGSATDVYDEYIWVNSAYEKIGSTDVDLTNYYTKTQTDELLDDKQDTLTAGTGISISANNVISATGGGGGNIAINSIGDGLSLDDNGELSVDFSTGEDVLFTYADLLPKYVNGDGTITDSTTALSSELCLLQNGKTYVMTSNITGTSINQGIRFRIYDANGNFLLAPTAAQYNNTYLNIVPNNSSYPYNATEYTVTVKQTVSIRVMFMDKTKFSEALFCVQGAGGSKVGKIVAIDTLNEYGLENFEAVAANTFRGKTIGMIGDSISAGQYASMAYSQIVANKLGMTLTNASVPGNKLSQIYNQISNLPATLDVVLFMGGTNNYKDTGDEGTLGTFFTDAAQTTLTTDNTVCGWINKILTALRNKYPTALIIILTPPKSTNHVSVGTIPYNFLQLNAAIKEAATIHSVPCFDVCAEVPINSWNEASAQVYYTHIWDSGQYSGQRDISHPTDEGQKMIANYIIGKLFTYSSL